MNIVFDIICIAVLVLITVKGARKGLASMLVSCVGTVVAVALALSLASPVSELCYNTFFESKIQSEVNKAVMDGADNPVSSGAQTAKILLEQNGTVSGLLKTFGISTNEIEMAASSENISAVSSNIVENVIKPPSLSRPGSISHPARRQTIPSAVASMTIFVRTRCKPSASR